MEAIDLRMKLSEEQRQYRQALIRRLRQDPAVLAFLKQSHLDVSALESNSGLFARWQKQKKTCRACSGLAFCQMPVKGRFCDLEVDDEGFLNEVYRSCRYKTKEDGQMAHAASFTFSHMQGKDYLISLDELEKTLDDQPSHYLLAYTRAMASLTRASGCLFFGQPGTGKSTLMMALANTSAQRKERVVYVRVPLLISQLKEHLDDEVFRRQTLGRMRSADVLFLDDFGSESATAWSRDEILFPVLDERMNNHKKTYFASNINLEELVIRYSLNGSIANSVAARRLIDRVRALATPIELMGHSRRQTPQIPLEK